jgi:pyruvate dehydrogenase E1 component alpha subunit
MTLTARPDVTDGPDGTQGPASAVPAITGPRPADFYRIMRLIRRFEERAMDLVKSGEIGSGIHACIGQEAVAAGTGAALRPDDILLANHRGHGQLLAKGCDPGRLLAEMAGRTSGVARGRGGSFHPSDFSAGVLASTGSVGHGAPLAAGAAWALARQGSDRIAVSVFGDGAINQGALLESFNLAALWLVPVIFICENNLYATTLPVGANVAGSVTGRAEAFGIPAESVDGMDPEPVYAAVARGVARARAGQGPTFLEFRTYRFEGHHTFELTTRPRYRDPEEVDSWKARDPLALQAGRVSQDERAQLDAEAEAIVAAAVQFALAGPKPDPAHASDYLYASGLRTRPGTAARAAERAV